MMKGEWFIRFGGRHKGSLSSAQVMDLWKRGEIKPSHMFWKKGMAHWQRFDSLEEFKSLFPSQKSSPEPYPARPKRARDESLEPKSVVKKNRDIQSFFLFAPFLIFLLGGVVFWLSSNNKIMKPDGLSQEEFLRMKKVAEVSTKKGVVFQFSFDSSVNRLWVSSNLVSQDDFFIRLNAIGGKVLAIDPIECTGEGRFYDHFAQLDYFDFTKGSQFYPGFYRIYLSYEFKGKTRSFSDVIYLGKGDQESFSQELALYRQSLKKSFQSHSSDLVQSYSTLDSLLTETETLLNDRITSLRNGLNVADFKREYTDRIGPMLTKFTSDNFFQPSRIPAGLNQLRRQFDILFDLSKSLAGLSAEISQTIEGKKKMSPAQISKLQNFYRSKFKTLKDNVHLQQERVKSLELSP